MFLQISFAVFGFYYFKPTKAENDDQPDCGISDTAIVDSLALAYQKTKAFIIIDNAQTK